MSRTRMMGMLKVNRSGSLKSSIRPRRRAGRPPVNQAGQRPENVVEKSDSNNEKMYFCLAGGVPGDHR